MFRYFLLENVLLFPTPFFFLIQYAVSLRNMIRLIKQQSCFMLNLNLYISFHSYKKKINILGNYFNSGCQASKQESILIRTDSRRS